MRRPRTQSSLLALLFALAIFGTARSEGEDADDGDLDLEDLEDSSAPEGEGQAVEDFDLGMPEEDRKKRMSACYTHMVNRVQHRRTELQQTVEQLMKDHGDKEDFTQDKAINSIVFSWMMSCYMNIDATGMKEAITGKMPSQELEGELFNPKTGRQQVPQASQRQWQMLQQVLTESAESQAKQQRQSSSSAGRSSSGSTTPPPQQPSYSGGGPLLSNLSGQSQAIYVLAVFGTIFGIAALGVMRLMRSEQEGREKSAKNKKADKAEKKASRKSK